ncbi:unnamed protein product [Darwinula stevensoni]|uniref:Nicotinamide phosphoribosyltransferase N-terminal domain-containing protein n=1 Tax=Darwinula stevensoni TaxID=69355 RepID=A0A7R8WYL3_9CRUS|nr:unnamed protein product [Darwinula stevensoni]CAG0879527.1 unnamed protein product [Darwinula stevensoni]
MHMTEQRKQKQRISLLSTPNYVSNPHVNLKQASRTAVKGYPVSHHMQYPPGTTRVYSYFESRGGKFPSTVFFGLQYILKRWMIGQVLTREKIEEARDLYQMHFGRYQAEMLEAAIPKIRHPSVKEHGFLKPDVVEPFSAVILFNTL